MGALYLLVLHVLQHVLWPTEWSGAIGFAILGGVGLFAAVCDPLRRQPGDVELMVDNIHVSGSATDVRMLRSLVPISWLCIASGGGMGPEAPLVQTTGTLASWTARARGPRRARVAGTHDRGDGGGIHGPLRRAARVGDLRARDPAPPRPAVLRGAPAGAPRLAVRLRGLRRRDGPDLQPVWHLPSPVALRPSDLGWAMAAGIGGALVAVVFTYLTTALAPGARRLPAEARPVIGGLLLAALGLASAYSLTFGEAQIGEILGHHGGTVAFFLLAALAKLAGTSVTLSSEWRGGFIIPLFFVARASVVRSTWSCRVRTRR